MNKSLNEPTEFIKHWMKDHNFTDAQLIPGQGWYAFKKGDVIPQCIQDDLTLYELCRQRVNPLVDLRE
jgi:hypothetical protein